MEIAKVTKPEDLVIPIKYRHLKRRLQAVIGDALMASDSPIPSTYLQKDLTQLLSIKIIKNLDYLKLQELESHDQGFCSITLDPEKHLKSKKKGKL